MLFLHFSRNIFSVESDVYHVATWHWGGEYMILEKMSGEKFALPAHQILTTAPTRV